MRAENKVLRKGTSRLLSLDVMRGMTIVGMIIVNNSGGPQSYDYLRHSVWNGLTPCDLVFPFFLFIMGVTTYLSLSKGGFNPTAKQVKKILWRAGMIVFIGWLLHWIELAFKGEPWSIDRLRLTGVLPRIGLCFGIVSLMSLYLSRRAMARSAVALLSVYTILLCMYNGYAEDGTNINSIIDRLLLGESHLYHKSPVDPEGLLGTLPSVAHTIIGFCCGAILKRGVGKDLSGSLLKLFTIGFLLLSVGFLFSEWLPLNKRIWSPTFMLVTTGLAALLLSTLTVLIDLWNPAATGATNKVALFRRGVIGFFEMFGVNPLFLYVVSEFLATLMSRCGCKAIVYECFLGIVGDPYLASALYAVSFMLLHSNPAYLLYRKRIYIKL